MKVYYVAGPYRADSERGVVENIRNAEAVAIQIWKTGHAALCPHKNTALFGGICPDEIWLSGGLELLRRCDGMVLVPGWEGSEGTKAEMQLAFDLGLPVMELDEFQESLDTPQVP